MKSVAKILFAILFCAVLGVYAFGQSDESAKTDMKQAAKATKRGAKKTAKQTKKGAKKVVHKSAKATRKGSGHVEDGTQEPPR
jgi:predicted RNase H-like HicB family nuclease